MTLDVETFAVAGPLLITPKRLADARGFFSETYSARAMAGVGVQVAFVQDNHSFSATAGTVRGLHFQVPPRAQAKLVRVSRGRVFDVCVDLRKGSRSYGRHASTELSADNWRQLFVPEGFAHGFCTLEPDTEVLYKTSDFYTPETDLGIRWNDPALGIAWPACAGACVSDRDNALPFFSSFPSPFIMAKDVT